MAKEKPQTKICKHCQTEIPYGAKICPQCKKKLGGKLKWIILAIIIIAIIGALAGSKNNKPKKVSDSDSSSSSQTESSTFKMGETAELNNVQVTMTNFKESSGGEFTKPADGNVFLMAEFEISNQTDKELAISSVLSFGAYADDYSLEYSFSAMMANEGNQLDGSIAPGKKMKGWIGWEVPKDYKNVEIHFTDDVWSNNKFVFVIEK